MGSPLLGGYPPARELLGPEAMSWTREEGVLGPQQRGSSMGQIVPDPIALDREEIILRAGMILRMMTKLTESQGQPSRDAGEKLREQAKTLYDVWKKLMDRLAAYDISKA